MVPFSCSANAAQICTRQGIFNNPGKINQRHNSSSYWTNAHFIKKVMNHGNHDKLRCYLLDTVPVQGLSMCCRLKAPGHNQGDTPIIQSTACLGKKQGFTAIQVFCNCSLDCRLMRSDSTVHSRHILFRVSSLQETFHEDIPLKVPSK